MRPVTEDTPVVKKTAQAADRPDPRPDPRPEPRVAAAAETDDPRARAAKRAAELRGHVETFDDGVDKFAAPRAPDGWTYEWKRKTVMGWEDPAYMSNMMRTGWEPVPSTRHPEMMAKGHSGAIERDGMILCERPLEISDEMRRVEGQKARQQVNIKAGQLDPKGRGGLMDRNDSNASMKINKGYEPMPIPD